MQTDMHYYGTYALARCAGVRDDIALAIATAAEYVDDSESVDIQLKDGEHVQGSPTAHHPLDGHNLDLVDQRRTWVPFHFVPGNLGNNEQERLRCQIDSPVAREMVARNLALWKEPFGIVLLGITAHVYADTFAHYGFSGITSLENQVRPGSIDLDVAEEVKTAMRIKENEFVARYIKGPAAEADLMAAVADWISKLGHAGVATYPDQPFLRWRFNYLHSDLPVEWRDNKITFLSGCRSLYQMFEEFHKLTKNHYFVVDQRRSIEAIEPVIQRILATVGEVDERIAAWQEAVTNGDLYPNPDREPIPRYDYARYSSDTVLLPSMDPEKARRTEVYDFISAANNHRKYMVEELLPKYQLPIANTYIKSIKETISDWLKK